jgi:primary-amine oxidase
MRVHRTRSRSRRLAVVVSGGVGLVVALIVTATPSATTPWQAFPAGLAFKTAGPANPLDPLSTTEVDTALTTIEGYSKVPAGSLFPIVKLNEPKKSDVLAGGPITREAFANVYDPVKNHTFEAIVDLKAKKITSWVAKTGVQPALSANDYVVADSIVRADSRWVAAMQARGLNPDDVYLDGWSSGEPLPAGANPSHHLMRELSFFRGTLPNVYDRPIEGVVATVDLTQSNVVDFVDTGIKPVNTTTTGNATSTRTDLKPLFAKQPQGPSFQIAGNAVVWQRWHFRVGWTPREGMVLYQIGYEDHGAVRPVIYRLSLGEIYVPYGTPDPNWAWRAALDVGEYNLGQYSEPLEAGVDVPSNAVFFDQASASDTGSVDGAFPLPHAIAMYERDAGSLWDRTDPTTLARDPRFARELVVTDTLPIGNYTYGFDYVFRMDGGIDVQIHATGTTLNQGVSSSTEGDRYGTTVAPNIAAPGHQHFFNFRIDFDVDGTKNRLVEQTTHSASSSTGNAFVTDAATVGSESSRDAQTNRWWVVQSTTRNNALGKPTGYALQPAEDVSPLSDSSFPMLQHAQFATHALWATRYRDGEFYSAGDYPNQGSPGLGLPKYIAGHQSIQGQDLVAWYTTGFTHVPTVEEYPVMTTDTTGFSIRPSGFFDSNPALDAP